LTGQIADLLFTPSVDGNDNLQREGIPPEKVHLVGNVMIDTLIRLLPAALSQLPKDLPPRYVLVTLHRPGNVDDIGWLTQLLDLLDEVGRKLPVLFPVHPRTQQRIAEAGRKPAGTSGLQLLPPAPYLEFLALQSRAAAVVTDSGGIQEETTFLGISCLTVRENTERPITVTVGSNTLVGRDCGRLRAELDGILARTSRKASVPPLWDGRAAERIADIIYCADRYRPVMKPPRPGQLCRAQSA
jgi:UDP-N-acetylglucosamine 2-epimerase (non-hydrolysing)